jgi:hypothetical protein
MTFSWEYIHGEVISREHNCIFSMYRTSCLIEACSETTLTGESQFHISTPLGFEPESLVTGSKRVIHWISETWWEWSEIAGSPQDSPPAANFVGCEAGRTCSEHETGTEKLCDGVYQGGLHVVGMKPSEAPEGWRSRWLAHYRREA